MRKLALLAVLLFLATAAVHAAEVRYYPVPEGTGPHDVAPAPDGTVWYTGQGNGVLGRLDPKTGKVEEVPLGEGSAPHGVVIGPDGAAWVTDGGQNAIVRVDPRSLKVDVFPLPQDAPPANLNTPAFDGKGVLWFTGQNGIYGRLDPRDGRVEVFDAPRGRGPYGIDATPAGEVWYASLAGSHIARIDAQSGSAEIVEPPTAGQGARRIWSDSKGRLWISEWNSGQVSRYEPADGSWKSWRLPGERPKPYAVYVDERDRVWLTDFGANAIVRFEPESERFTEFPSDRPNANVRQLLGRPGEVWGAESGTDRLVVIRD
ncbi:MAG TPA: lyase [Alphaproteobacteria bacterium]